MARRGGPVGLRTRTQTAQLAEEDDVDGALSGWMREAGRFRTWPAGAQLFRQGDRTESLLLIRSGSVKVVAHAAGGKQVVLALRGPGDVLGEFAALDGLPRSASVLALTAVDGWVVPSVDFRFGLSARPEAAVELLRLLVSRLRDADRYRLEFGSLDTTSRVAGLLFALDRQHGPGGWIRLTQSEIGQAVGSSREATVKALARLRSAGLVITGRGRVRLARPDRVRRVADGERVESSACNRTDPH